MKQDQKPRALRVPSGRLERLARLGGLATDIAARSTVRAIGDLRQGRRPDTASLLLSPSTIGRLTSELARMRGAAMKLGQLLSMDAGDLLPPELAEILSRLRNQADFMPPAQLKTVLNANWKANWLDHFSTFEVRPIAAASIGQVHRATLRNGQRVAIKIQYPRIAQSIDSDIANIGALLRLSGLFPKGFDLAPYLDEARRLLREETDYLREGASLTRFRERHAGADGIIVPQYFPEWSTAEVLTMEYIEGQTLDTAAGLPQVERDRIVSKLVDLFLYEVFEIGEMQSDPNFANYLINNDGCIALLDFGAVRPLPAHLQEYLRAFMTAGMTNEREQLRKLATDIGYLTTGDALHNEQIFRMILEVFSDLRGEAIFDFASATLPQRLQSDMIELVENGYQPPLLPMEILYLHRKAAGLFLLGSRLKARANIKYLILQRLSPQSWALA